MPESTLGDCHYCGAEGVPVREDAELTVFVGNKPSPGALCAVCQGMNMPTTIERHNSDLARCTRMILDAIAAHPAYPAPVRGGAGDCWFVERSPIQAPAQWWAGLDHAAHTPELHLWTSDPHRALRFDTKEQAERAAARYFDKEIWEATEHEFVSTPAQRATFDDGMMLAAEAAERSEFPEAAKVIRHMAESYRNSGGKDERYEEVPNA